MCDISPITIPAKNVYPKSNHEETIRHLQKNALGLFKNVNIMNNKKKRLSTCATLKNRDMKINTIRCMILAQI